jgi:hemolysin III
VNRYFEVNMLPRKHAAMDRSHYSVGEEWMNITTHGFGFVLAIFGLILMLVRSQTAAETISVAIYGASLALMFLSSAAYHACQNVDLRAVLRKVDHTAIYLLIAGSYTPFLLLSVGGLLGTIAMIVVWLIGIGGILFKVISGHRYPKVGVATYAAMGWLAILLIYPIYQSLTVGGFSL